jgi:hypothetical protein
MRQSRGNSRYIRLMVKPWFGGPVKVAASEAQAPLRIVVNMDVGPGAMSRSW